MRTRWIAGGFFVLLLSAAAVFTIFPSDAKAPATGSRPGGNGHLMLRRVPINDANGWIGGKAGSLLAPADWKVDAHIEWFHHPTMPGRIALHAVSSDGRDRIDIYPQMTYFMGPTVVPMHEGKSVYYGNTYLRPVGGADALMDQIVLPRLHSDKGYEVVNRSNLPAYAGAVQEMNSSASARSHAEARRVRIRYTESGREITEDVIGVYAAQEVGPVVFWQAQFIMAVASDAARIDETARLHAAMTDSIRIDPQWFNKFLQISEAFQQLAYMNQDLAANQSRIISELSDYVTENRRQVYENTQRAFDRVNRNYSQYVRGVETWQNHHGQTMELPSGYTRGWQSDDGTVLITDNPDLNPNTDPKLKNKNWHNMSRKGN